MVSGYLAELGQDGNAFVAEGVTVGSTDSLGIMGRGSNHNVNIQGTVIAQMIAVYTGDSFSDTGNHVLIGENGYVTSMNYTSHAVAMLSNSSTLENHGVISAGDSAVAFGGNASMFGSRLINSGTIEASVTAVIAQATEATYTDNSGLIKADYTAFLGNVGVNTLVNTGRIVGVVSLDDGDDLYDGRGGHLKGSMFGGAGNDTIRMGVDNDVINGQMGNDILTGGKGRDVFIFDNPLGRAGNIDRITDFNVKDDTIKLDRDIFSDLSAGRLGIDAFAVNTTGKAGDLDDRIIYETDTGKLFYDHDGKGGDAAVQFAVVSKNLDLTAADFFII
jgi:Ca2+-binding RTX toxin-like protein